MNKILESEVEWERRIINRKNGVRSQGSFLREDKNHTVPLSSVNLTIDPMPDVLKALEDKERLKDVTAYWSPKQREVMNLRYVHEKSKRETAEILGIKLDKVSKIEYTAGLKARNIDKRLK